MAIDDLSMEEIKTLFRDITIANEAAAMASLVNRYRPEARDVLAGAFLAFLADVCDVNVEVAVDTARKLREDREAQFGCGLCSSLDDPPKA